MAHRILGIDLGAFSVKVIVLKSGFRQSAAVDWIERPLPPAMGPEETIEERGVRALGALLRERGLEHDVPYAAMSGDALSIRVLDFPFTGLKRADLEKTIGAELESQLPHDLDEMVYAFDPLPKIVEPVTVDEDVVAAPTGKPSPITIGGAAPGTTGSRFLAAATTQERVRGLIELIVKSGSAPHGLIAAPVAYTRVIGKLSAGAGGSVGGLLLIDMGHARTNIAVLRDGKTVYGRTLSRGGRHVTQAMAKMWNLSFEDAERSKHTEGFVASLANPAPSDAWARISDVVKAELTPVLREIRQTIAACRAQTGAGVERVLLVGGAARLNGLLMWLADELELPVSTLTSTDAAALFGPALAARVPADTALLALAVALEGASGRPAFDMLQGPLAYRSDYQFLRAKAGYLAVCGLLLVAFGAGAAYASLYRLRTEKAMLDKRLETETTEIFGTPYTVEDVEARLAPKKEVSPLPKMTALDLFVEISKKLPPRAEGKLDVLELEIEPKKVFIKAVADSSATIDSVQKKLKEIDCFGEVTPGRVDTVSDGKQFTLTIPAKCM